MFKNQFKFTFILYNFYVKFIVTYSKMFENNFNKIIYTY